GSTSGRRHFREYYWQCQGFNPCYAGSTSGRQALVNAFAQFMQVSILVMLDLRAEEDQDFLDRLAITCFNPCYAGSTSGSYCITLSDGRTRSFQSLLCWIYERKPY